MRSSLAGPPPKLLTPSRAWTLLLLNLLVLPGLGSLLGRHRLSGLAQIVLTVAGFVMSVLWFVAFLTACLRDGQLPADGGAYARCGVTGLVLFLGGWLWSLASSVQILRQARSNQYREHVERADQ